MANVSESMNPRFPNFSSCSASNTILPSSQGAKIGTSMDSFSHT